MRGVVVDRDDEPAMAPRLTFAAKTDSMCGRLWVLGDRAAVFPTQVIWKRSRDEGSMKDQKAVLPRTKCGGHWSALDPQTSVPVSRCPRQGWQ